MIITYCGGVEHQDKRLRIEGHQRMSNLFVGNGQLEALNTLYKPTAHSHYSPSTTINTSLASSPSRDPLDVDPSILCAHSAQ